MFGIAFYFEDNDKDVYSGRNIDLDIWRITLKAFGGTSMHIIDTSTGGSFFKIADEEIKVFRYNKLEDFIITQEENIVFVDTEWTHYPNTQKISLTNFQHGRNSIYAFGSSKGFEFVPFRKSIIYIPQHGRGAMYPSSAMAIVLADRYRKLNG